MRVTGRRGLVGALGEEGGGGRTVKDGAVALTVAAQPESGRARCEVGSGAIGVFRGKWWEVFVGVGALEGGLDGGRVELEEGGERLLRGLFVEGVAVHGGGRLASRRSGGWASLSRCGVTLFCLSLSGRGLGGSELLSWRIGAVESVVSTNEALRIALGTLEEAPGRAGTGWLSCRQPGSPHFRVAVSWRCEGLWNLEKRVLATTQVTKPTSLEAPEYISIIHVFPWSQRDATNQGQKCLPYVSATCRRTNH